MARRSDFNGSTKTIAASTTVTFTPSDIPSDRIVAYHFNMTATDAAGNGVDTLTRIRVKSNGVTRWDIDAGHYLNMMEKLQPSNVLMGSTNQSFSIWFAKLDEPNEDVADQYQFEPNANASIELVFGGTAEAGAVACGWTQSNIPAKWYTKYYSQQMNIANGAINGRFNLAEGGEIMGYSVPSLGLTRLRLVLNGEQWVNLGGSDIQTIQTTNGQGLLRESQAYLTAITPTTTAPLNYYQKFTARVPATPGSSFVEIDTNGAGAWVGTANEFGLHVAVPVGS